MLNESCPIPADDPLYQRYHDQEWGVPVFDDRVFFEKICLEGFQSGLSWRTILHRRQALRHAFDEFNPETVAHYRERDVERLMANKDIIRNRKKIISVINNAQRYLELHTEAGSLANLCWGFQPEPQHRPAKITLAWLTANPSTQESTRLSKLLKQRGWSFVGPTTVYAMMQALGIVNDHVNGCPRRKQIEDTYHRPHSSGPST